MPDVGGVIAYWSERVASPAYLDLLEHIERSQAEGEWLETPEGHEVEPLELSELEQIEQAAESGWVANACQDRGDGAAHDRPKFHPFLSGHYRWDPLDMSWSAMRQRGRTAMDTFTRLWWAWEDLGFIQLEVTLPSTLWGHVAGRIRNVDRGKGFKGLCWRFVQALWELEDRPGTPLGAWINVHMTGTDNPHRFQPHAHILVPAVGVTPGTEAEPGRPAGFTPITRPHQKAKSPLHVEKERLDDYRRVWAGLLEETYGGAWMDGQAGQLVQTTLDGADQETKPLPPVNLHYRWLYMGEQDGRGVPGWARLLHACKYNSRGYLEDVNKALCRVDSEDGLAWLEDKEGKTRRVDLEDLVGGMLERVWGMPSRWRQGAWFGQLASHKRGDLLERLGVAKDPEEPETLAELLEMEGRAWARGHEDREPLELLDSWHHHVSQTIRHLGAPSASSVLTELGLYDHDASGLSKLEVWMALGEAAREAATWVLEIGDFCSCGQACEELHDLSGAELQEIVEACRGPGPDREQIEQQTPAARGPGFILELLESSGASGEPGDGMLELDLERRWALIEAGHTIEDPEPLPLPADPSPWVACPSCGQEHVETTDGDHLVGDGAGRLVGPTSAPCDVCGCPEEHHETDSLGATCWGECSAEAHAYQPCRNRRSIS